MTEYTQQVEGAHYARGSYRSQDRWNSYWHQLSLVRSCNPRTILEIGVGEGVVARELRYEGKEVTTLDIAADLNPDIVGSVTDLPLPDTSYDLVLAAEILEHIRFEDVPEAFRQIARVAAHHVVVSVPHPGYVFSLEFKLPLMRRIILFTKLPFFWKVHQFDGQHYWELGKRDYPVRAFVKVAEEAGLVFQRSHCYADDPARRYFVFSV
jgi:ubiquinone/menaquinone biosynthesis C-methylase UbiE